MSPFHDASTLSSSAGCTRGSRAACRSARARPIAAISSSTVMPSGPRDLLRLARDEQDAVALEVGPVVDAPVGERRARQGGIAEDRADLVGRPDEELALDALRVGVLGRVEAAGRVGHLAPDVVEGLLGDAPVERLAGGEPAVQVERGELGVVVEHLLEVRHQPLAVHRVAVEAAAELVVDAAAGHAGERVAEHPEAARVAGAARDAQHRLPGHRLGELGRLPEAAVALVELAADAEVGPA